MQPSHSGVTLDDTENPKYKGLISVMYRLQALLHFILRKADTMLPQRTQVTPCDSAKQRFGRSASHIPVGKIIHPMHPIRTGCQIYCTVVQTPAQSNGAVPQIALLPPRLYCLFGEKVPEKFPGPFECGSPLIQYIDIHPPESA